jgi:hypothetical protein
MVQPLPQNWHGEGIHDAKPTIVLWTSQWPVDGGTDAASGRIN